MTLSSPFTVLSSKTFLVRRKGRRTKEEIEVLYRSPVVLECPTEADFPLAVRIRDLTRSRAEQLIDYRNFRGRIFAPDIMHFANGRKGNFPASLIGHAFEGGQDLVGSGAWLNPFLDPGQLNDDDPRDGSLPIQVAEVLHDGEIDRNRELARLASRYLVFAGMLWKETDEPVFYMSPAIGSWSPGAMTVVAWSEPSIKDAPFMFRLDRGEVAARFATALGQRNAYAPHEIIQHLDSRLLARDDRLQAALAIGRAVTNETRIRWVKLLDPAGARTLARLMDLTENSTASADAIGSAAGRLLKTLQALDLNVHGRKAMEDAMKHLHPACLRWTDFEGGSLDGDELSEDQLALLADLG
ncbi:hypothetical protein ACVIGB_000833 [Bradyrhizobium sp. USDA 4341]